MKRLGLLALAFILVASLAISINNSAFRKVLGISTGPADSPWPLFMGDANHTGQSTYDTSHVDGSVKWRFDTGGRMSASPVLGKDGTIYVIDQKCNLSAINPNGTEKWKLNVGEPIVSKEWGDSFCSQSTPAVAKDGTIYLGTMTGNFFAINSKG